LAQVKIVKMAFCSKFSIVFLLILFQFFASIDGLISPSLDLNRFKDLYEVDGDAKSVSSDQKVDHIETLLPEELEVCSAPESQIGVVVEGIANGVKDSATNHSAYYQLSRPHIGSCSCSDGLTKVFYQSQETSSVFDTEAIRVLCGGDFSDFCACDIDGMCFKQSEPITYAEIQPYCEDEGCFAYLELYQGSIVGPQDQKAISVKYESLGGSYAFGVTSPYMKVAAVSCNGCAQIQKATCSGEYTELL